MKINNQFDSIAIDCNCTPFATKKTRQFAVIKCFMAFNLIACVLSLNGIYFVIVSTSERFPVSTTSEEIEKVIFGAVNSMLFLAKPFFADNFDL